MKSRWIKTCCSVAVMSMLLLLWACGDGGKSTKNKSEKVTAPPVSVEVPPFNSDSAYFFVKKQVDFGPRVPNTKAHKACGDFLIAQLKAYGAEVSVQAFDSEAFDGKMLYLKNIIASFNANKSKRILLAAHWDTRPFADKDTIRQDEPIDGANDGASGVGVLLEIGRILSQDIRPEVGVDIIFFDGEDYGEPEGYVQRQPGKIWWCLGSQYWSKNKHKKSYAAYYGILLDMVGARQARFYREAFSMQYAPSIVKKVWDQANQLGYSDYFVYAPSGAINDDHVYVSEIAKIPMIDIIEFDPSSDRFFAGYHHTHADNMDIIDKKTLQAVGETVLHVLFSER